MDKEAYLIKQFTSSKIGDDGAVIGSSIYSADAFCEGTHFRRHWMNPTQIGRKAMLVNFSDAVAMNAQPRYALITLSLPKDFSQEEIRELAQAMEQTAAEWGCEIIGGDTVGGDKLHLSVTLISHSDAPLLRTGIEAGDLLAFTGTLGESRRDLMRLESGEAIAEDSRFYAPKLRADFVAQARPWLRAGMDISDGLFCDTNALLDVNKYGMEILKNIDNDSGLGGEEYEMLIAFESNERERIESISNSLDIPLTIFAKVSHNSKRFPCRSHHFDEHNR